MKLIFFLSIIFITASCGKQPPAVTLFYSDGSVINDTVHLFLLKRQLPEILKENNIRVGGLKIYTSLRPNINTELKQLLKPMEDSIYAEIDWRYELHSGLRENVDRYRGDGRFFQTAVIAIDNRTGQIVAYFSNDAWKDGDFLSATATIGNLQKTFTYAMALQEGYSLSDRYPQLDFRTKKPDPSVNCSLLSAFSRGSGTVLYGLDQQFSQRRCGAFLQRLHIPYRGEIGSFFRFDVDMNLKDVTKTYSAFYNKGLLLGPSIVDSIVNRSGKTVYRGIGSFERIMDEKAAYGMMQLLDAYTHSGYGSSFSNEPTIPDFCGNFGVVNTGYNGSGWFIGVLGDYTIGVRNFLSRRDIRRKRMSRSVQIREMTVPLWLKTVKMLRKDRRSVPKLPVYAKEPYVDPEPIRMDIQL